MCLLNIEISFYICGKISVEKNKFVYVYNLIENVELLYYNDREVRPLTGNLKKV